MARVKKKDFIEETIEKLPKDELAEMPLNSLEDYRAYNKKARELNKKLRVCRYKVKQCPIELHPKDRVQVFRIQQPDNPIPCFLVNEDIEFNEVLKAKKNYDLPKVVIDHLNKRGQTKWGWVELPDGSKETQIVGVTPSFSIRTVQANV